MALRLGDLAPDFTAASTDGDLHFHEWKHDRWAVLFSHPADFTPVCTTELGRTAALKDGFASRNCLVAALSVDTVEDHHRWAPDIGAIGGTELNFPIIADPDGTIASSYDMIHPGEGDMSTVRSVFIIGPDHRIKMTMTYPKSTGRNFDEILRVLDSLQLTASHALATPVDWKPGDRVIVPPTMSTEEAEQTFADVEEIRPYLRYATDPSQTSS